MKLEIEDKIILLLIKLELKEDEILVLNNYLCNEADWNSFYKRILLSGHMGNIYKNFLLLPDKAKIPKNIFSSLKKRYLTIYFNNQQKYNDLESIIEYLHKSNINLIPLKGILLTHFIYQDLGRRSMSDIDLLVKKEDLEKCKAAFITLGWEIVPQIEMSKFISKIHNSQHPYIFKSPNHTVIEIHQHIHSGLTTYQVDINQLWDKSEKISFNRHQISTLNYTDFLLHLCLHLYKHLINSSPISLKHFCDISELINKQSQNISWDRLIEYSYAYKCQIEVREILTICQNYFHTPIPENVINKFTGVSKINTEHLFLAYLKNDQVEIKKHTVSDLQYYKLQYKNIDGWFKKRYYLMHIVFPSKQFMINKYKIKYKSLFFLYYFSRIILLSSELIKGIKKIS